jgi:hypothetical protein
MARLSGTYVTSSRWRDSPRLVPHPLPPVEPQLSPLSYEIQNRTAEIALARLMVVSGLAVRRMATLLCSPPRRERAERGSVQNYTVTAAEENTFSLQRCMVT